MNAIDLPRSDIIDLLNEAGAIRTHSCCGIEDKFCSTDLWKVNMEGLIKVVWRAAQQEVLNEMSGWNNP